MKMQKEAKMITEFLQHRSYRGVCQLVVTQPQAFINSLSVHFSAGMLKMRPYGKSLQAGES
jgi:hypothetical protein